MGYRSSAYAIERSLELLKILLALEGRDPGMLDVASAANLNFRTVQKYIQTLEKMGLVSIEPTERKNVVRLTERGRCVARCLVG